MKYSGFHFSVVTFSDIVQKRKKSSSIYVIKGPSDDEKNEFILYGQEKNDDFMFIVANGFFM